MTPVRAIFGAIIKLDEKLFGMGRDFHLASTNLGSRFPLPFLAERVDRFENAPTELALLQSGRMLFAQSKEFAIQLMVELQWAMQGDAALLDPSL